MQGHTLQFQARSQRLDGGASAGGTQAATGSTLCHSAICRASGQTRVLSALGPQVRGKHHKGLTFRAHRDGGDAQEMREAGH